MNASPVAFYAVLSIAAGVFIPIMAALSGSLGRALGSPWSASVIVITGAFLMVFATAAVNGGLKFPADTLARITPLQVFSGFAMAFYVCAITYLAPRFGVGNAVMLVVAGQIASSAAIDHFGLFGAPQKTLDAMRVAGLVIMVVGVVIAQLAANKPTA